MFFGGHTISAHNVEMKVCRRKAVCEDLTRKSQWVSKSVVIQNSTYNHVRWIVLARLCDDLRRFYLCDRIVREVNIVAVETTEVPGVKHPALATDHIGRF